MADYLSQFTGPEIDSRLAKVSQLESGKQDNLVSGTNIKTINGQSVLGSGDLTVQAGDTDAVKYVSQTLTDAQKAQARANIDAASLEDIQDMDFVTAATLPTASSSTMGHIYLIGPDGNDNYDRYFTQESGGSYSWVPLGSTQIALSTYATQEELTQLEQKVGELVTGGTVQETIDLSQYTPDASFVNGQGLWANATSDTVFSAIIPVTPGKYTISTPNGQNIVAFLSAPVPLHGAAVSFGTVNGSATSARITIPANSSQEFTILDTDTTIYLVVRVDTSTAGAPPPTIVHEYANLVLLVPTKEEFDALEDGVEATDEKVDELNEEITYKEEKEFSWVNDVMATGGNFINRTDRRSTTPILLRKGETAHITTAGDGSYTLSPIVQVSGPNAPIKNSYPCTTLVLRIDNNVHTYDYTANSDIYVVLSGQSNCTVSFDVVSESRIERLEETVSRKLQDKHIYVFGASNTSNSTAGVVGFMELIANAARLPYRAMLYDSADGNNNDTVIDYPAITNYAKDGTTIRVISGRTDGVLARMKRHILGTTVVDYVVLGFPANDAAQQYINLGTISEGYTGPFDTDTQIGALEDICKYITELGKPLHFGCIIPWRITWVGNDFYDNYIPVLEKWGVPYIDLRKCAGFDIKNCAAHRNLYSLTADDYSTWSESTTYNLDDKVKYGGSLYKCNSDGVVGIPPTNETYWMLVSSESGDGTHLNSIGNAIVAGKILSFIEGL